jgi:hypothetical protein
MEVRVNTASILLVAGLFFVGSRASADTTAVYKAKSKDIPITMTVEVADNGNLRYQMSSGRTYGLTAAGVDYLVDLSHKEPVVDRVDDLMAAEKEQMAHFLEKFRQHPIAAPQLVPIGKVTVNGRTGQAYGYQRDKGTNATVGVTVNDRPGLTQPSDNVKRLVKSEIESAARSTVVVISDDPDLVQLRSAMAREFGASRTMFSGMMGNAPSPFDQMASLLAKGAPLSFAGMDLQSVNHMPIDPNRFKLPARLETLDEIRQRLKPLAPPPTAAPQTP